MNVREALDNIYKEFEKTYEEAKEEGREQGLEEAWECTRKIACTPEKGGYTWSALEQIFNTRSLSNIINTYTASEAISKIKEYEEKQKKAIEVGDEVTLGFTKGIVTRIENHVVDILWGDGSTGEWSKDDFDREFRKTERHFPVMPEVLRKMQEEE